eukprot:6053446-Prymnesium_polylepis.1
MGCAGGVDLWIVRRGGSLVKWTGRNTAWVPKLADALVGQMFAARIPSQARRSQQTRRFPTIAHETRYETRRHADETHACGLRSRDRCWKCGSRECSASCPFVPTLVVSDSERPQGAAGPAARLLPGRRATARARACSPPLEGGCGWNS